jgi:hypothetical protein
LTLANLAVRVGPLGGDDTDDLSILIGKIHDTTLDAALWNQTLRKAAGFVGGPNTALWSKDAGDVSGGDVHGAIRRILDLAPPERAKLTGKLNDWPELDFAAFRKEVKRAFHADIPVRERGEWEGYLRDNAAHVRELSDRIASGEREIDRIV